MKGAAQDFFDTLQSVTPAQQPEVEEWPPFPSLQLELSRGQIRALCEVHGDQREQVAESAVLHAGIADSDREAARLFGMPSIPAQSQFEILVRAWFEEYPLPKRDG